MEMTSELIPEMIPELTGDQAEIGDPDGCPLTDKPHHQLPSSQIPALFLYVKSLLVTVMSIIISWPQLSEPSPVLVCEILACHCNEHHCQPACSSGSLSLFLYMKPLLLCANQLHLIVSQPPALRAQPYSSIWNPCSYLPLSTIPSLWPGIPHCNIWVCIVHVLVQ